MQWLLALSGLVVFRVAVVAWLAWSPAGWACVFVQAAWQLVPGYLLTVSVCACDRLPAARQPAADRGALDLVRHRCLVWPGRPAGLLALLAEMVSAHGCLFCQLPCRVWARHWAFPFCADAIVSLYKSWAGCDYTHLGTQALGLGSPAAFGFDSAPPESKGQSTV